MRRRTSAGVLALLTAAGAVLVGTLAPGAAVGDDESAARTALGAAAPAPVTTTGQGLTMTVDPTENLAPSGATVRVTGSGFDDGGTLYVAVCAADADPGNLTNCIGGAIPEANATTGWGEVTADGKPTTAGPAVAKWGPGGSFDLTLVLPDAVGSSVDCVSDPCSVLTSSADSTDRSQDLSVPVSFNPPPTQPSQSTTSPPPTTASPPRTTASPPPTTASTPPTTPTTTQQPSTQTITAVKTTVTADSIQAPSVAAGGTQVIRFSGFDPGETVALTLYSAPMPLPPTTANAVGQVRAEFTVPEDLSATTHLLQARGETSGTVGIAEFTVTPAVPTAGSSVSDSVSSTVSSPVSSASVAQSSSALASSASPTAVTSVQGSAVSSRPATPSAGSAATGRNLWWIWVVLAVIVLVGLAAGVIAWLRARSDDDDDVPYVVAGGPTPPSPGWENPTFTAPPGGYGPSGPGGSASAPPYPGQTGGAIPLGHEFGLLSGRDHPDGPALLSGGPHNGPFEARTQVNPVRPHTVEPDKTEPENTEPHNTEPHNTESGTQQWAPDFTDQRIPPVARPQGPPSAAQPPAGQHPVDQPPAGPSPAGPSPAGPSPAGPSPAGPQTAGPPPTTQPPAGPPANRPADPGPGTEQWKPDFDEPDPDDQGPTAGRHRGD